MILHVYKLFFFKYVKYIIFKYIINIMNTMSRNIHALIREMDFIIYAIFAIGPVFSDFSDARIR